MLLCLNLSVHVDAKDDKKRHLNIKKLKNQIKQKLIMKKVNH